MKKILIRLKERFSGKKKADTPPRPPLENPYRRFYTPERSVEQLARQAREQQKREPKG